MILTDDTWDVGTGASICMAIYNRRGDLVYAKYKRVEGGDPFYAVTRAVWKFLEYVSQGEQEGMFHVLRL